MESTKKTIMFKPQLQPSAIEKKTAVPVKNIKAKALGQSVNQSSTINPYKPRAKKTEEKEN